MKLLTPYLEEMIKREAADLFITVGSPPSLRVEGKLVEFDMKPLSHDAVEGIINDVLTEEQKHDFATNLELNIALTGSAGERFRANFFYQQHHRGMVVRRIKAKIPTAEQLKLPPIYNKMVMEKRGLILMVGSVASGKSTSMAVMLEHRNLNGSGHIVTIEDPIEFVHEHHNCIFTQREVGIDTLSYSIALKNALRQSPDMIVIGEIRDRETMENALIFCETGHLCMATLHANNSNQAIERIVNLFPEEQQKQIFITLSQNLKAIFSQRLVTNVHGGLTLATEVLINQALARQLIAEGKVRELKDLMEKSRDQGMNTFDQCLLDFVKSGEISIEVALREADNPGNLKLRINQEMLNRELMDSSPSPEIDYGKGKQQQKKSEDF